MKKRIFHSLIVADEEACTMLAALRLWIATLNGTVNSGMPEGLPYALAQLATKEGKYKALKLKHLEKLFSNLKNEIHRVSSGGKRRTKACDPGSRRDHKKKGS